MEKSIAIVSYSRGSTDPRIIKQILALKDNYRVTFIGFDAPKFDDVAFEKIESNQIPVSFLERFITAFSTIFMPAKAYFRNPLQRKLEKILKQSNFDLILANDMVMPACVKFRKNAAVVFDAHEYYLDARSDLRFRLTNRRVKAAVLRKYVPKLSGFITVSEGLRDLYADLLELTPNVIYNTVWYRELRPNIVNSGEQKIRLIHHGAFYYKRKIQDYVDLINR